MEDESTGKYLAGPFKCSLQEVAKTLTAEGKEPLLDVKKMFLACFPEDICRQM